MFGQKTTTISLQITLLRRVVELAGEGSVVVAVGVGDRWQIIIIIYSFQNFVIFWVLVLLFAHIEKFSISRLRDFLILQSNLGYQSSWFYKTLLYNDFLLLYIFFWISKFLKVFIISQKERWQHSQFWKIPTFPNKVSNNYVVLKKNIYSTLGSCIMKSTFCFKKIIRHTYKLNIFVKWDFVLL